MDGIQFNNQDESIITFYSRLLNVITGNYFGFVVSQNTINVRVMVKQAHGSNHIDPEVFFCMKTHIPFDMRT